MPILEQIRQHVETDLGDEALGRIIADAVEEVEGRYGDDAEMTVLLYGEGSCLLRFQRPVASVTSAKEYDRFGILETTLTSTDYRVVRGGRLIERLLSGPNPVRGVWAPRVEVVYTPIPEISLRDRVVIDLVKLACQYNGAQEEDFGSNEYRYKLSDYGEEREKLLSSISRHRGFRYA
jgi:hypothetical protein